MGVAVLAIISVPNWLKYGELRAQSPVALIAQAEPAEPYQIVSASKCSIIENLLRNLAIEFWRIVGILRGSNCPLQTLRIPTFADTTVWIAASKKF